MSARRCTAEYRSGHFCDRPGLVGAPFPICAQHAIRLHIFMVETVAEVRQDPERLGAATATALLAEYDDRVAAHRTWVRSRDAQVYYGRLNDLIKIGTTGNLRARLSSYPPGFILLATEPGGTELESHRLQQFRAFRVGVGEWFRPSAVLLAHIESLRETVRA